MFRLTVSNDDFKIKAGNICNLSGDIFAIRDQSAARLKHIYHQKGSIPIDLENSLIFFAGPTPGFEANAHSSIGPTTSARMVRFFDFFIERKVAGFIGKGALPEDMIEMLIANEAYYFQAIGGAGAYYGKKIEKIETILFPELGPEAVFTLEVNSFPLIVSVDLEGNRYF